MNRLVKNWLCIVLTFALLLTNGCGGVDNASHSSENGDFSSYEFSDTLDSLYQSSESSTAIESEEPLSSPNAESEISSAKSEPLKTSSQEADNTSSPSSKPKTSSAKSSSSKKSNTSSSLSSQKPSSATQKESIMKGIWISYYELPFWGCNEETAKEKFLNMMRLVSAQGYNTVFCHVRANADAFYPSKYFPFAKQLTGTQGVNPGYDPLKIMIWAAKSYGLEFHAWINPYRVSNTGTDPSALSSNNIAVKWLSDGSNRAIAYGNGIYFNPADKTVQRLILNGVKEILNNYKIDGIHFDDYFYPSGVSKKFDSVNYTEYTENTANPLSLDDWRRANVNTLVSSVYRLCKEKKVTFGISPMADISYDNSDTNYKNLYADVTLWMRKEGYVDYIMPQLYHGYKHPIEKSRYGNLLNIWANLEKHKNLKLYIGLGAYKMDEDCADKEEWHKETDLLARQAVDAINIGAKGFVVFSYRSSVSQKEHNTTQIKNMFKAVNALKIK